MLNWNWQNSAGHWHSRTGAEEPCNTGLRSKFELWLKSQLSIRKHLTIQKFLYGTTNSLTEDGHTDHAVLYINHYPDKIWTKGVYVWRGNRMAVPVPVMTPDFLGIIFLLEGNRQICFPLMWESQKGIDVEGEAVIAIIMDAEYLELNCDLQSTEGGD